jgi:peptidyl-prolyl cis-trans isomerase B (cyclophilin B)
MVSGGFSEQRFWIPILILSLLPALACGRYEARKELKLSSYYAEILKRVDRHRIGEDGFFEQNLLSNPEPEVREWCAVALGRIGSPSALPLLYKATRSESAAVRAASAFSIGILQDRDFLQAQSLAADAQAPLELRRLLDDSSIPVRMRALEALGRIGTAGEEKEIVQRLEHLEHSRFPAEFSYFETAITALARLKEPAALPFLKQLANSADPQIRQRSLDALARLQEAKPVSADSLPAKEPEFRDDPNLSPITDPVATALAANRKNSTIAIVETTRGTLEIELFRQDAPLTVADFALMADRGDFDGFVFKQVEPSQWAGGDYVKTPFKRDIHGEVNMHPFERGSLGMTVAGGRHERGRFFIALAPQPYLDGIDTCFGRVISGVQVVERIIPGDSIRRVRIKDTISSLDHVRY